VRRSAIFIVLLALLYIDSPSSAATKHQMASQEAIEEAVFRYQMSAVPFDDTQGEIYQGRRPGFHVFFLSLKNDRDPSHRVMRCFTHHQPPVKAVSQCRRYPRPKHEGWALSENARHNVFDKRTGQNGIICYISHLKWLNRFSVSVEGSYYAGWVWTQGYRYTVVLNGGRWTVIGIKKTWEPPEYTA